MAIRITTEQKRELERKAKRRGLSVSSWLPSLGLAAPEEPASIGLAVVAILALGLDAYLGPSRPDDQVAKQQEGYAGHDQFLADSDVCAGHVGSHSRKHPHPNLDSETGPDANNAVAIFTLLLVSVGYLQRRTMVAQQTTLAEQVALTRTVERPWLGPAKIEAGYLKSRGIIRLTNPSQLRSLCGTAGNLPHFALPCVPSRHQPNVDEARRSAVLATRHLEIGRRDHAWPGYSLTRAARTGPH